MPGARAGRLGLALALDFWLGEPPERWHPVCWMGRAVSLAERPFIRARVPATAQRAAGTVVALTLPAVTWLAARRITRLAPPRGRFALEALMLWTALAGRELYRSAMGVERGLAASLEQGRDAVARLVGRDTGRLDAEGVARAAVESVAENANDGVIAPLLYGFAGGAPLALAYKMVNTLDSMVGYRDGRYRDFGWAAARLDDAAGYLPARLTATAVVAAGAAVGADPVGAAGTWMRDAGAHDSPNAGVCEAAFAGALGVRLGGPASYGGVLRERAVLGDGLRPPLPADIARAARLMLAALATVMAAMLALDGAARRARAAMTFWRA